MVLAGWIGFEIMTTCQSARATYSGDCVDALISVLKDENQSFAAKNDAVWAIGQLGDQRALTTLQTFYTGQIPDREPWGEVLSQYELKKAIALLEGSPNLPSILWRNFD
jgi:HEAT repeat protein